MTTAIDPLGALGRRIVARRVQADIRSWDAARAILAEGGTPGTSDSMTVSPFVQRARENRLPVKVLR